MKWTGKVISLIISLFILSGIFEIGGGWFIWEYMRNSKPWWYTLIGSFMLIIYGFLPTFQPLESFGRLYAIYGGIFIGMSFSWSAIFDGFKPDLGDLIGSLFAFIGILIILFWPRSNNENNDSNRSDQSENNDVNNSL